MFLTIKTWKVNLFTIIVFILIYSAIGFNFSQIKKIEAKNEAQTLIKIKTENLQRTEKQIENINFLFNSLHDDLNKKIGYIDKLFKNEGKGIKTYSDDYHNIYINKKDDNTLFIEVVVYYDKGIYNYKIGKSTIIEIEKDLGEPNAKEYNFKYIYKNNNNTISFLFNEGGVLKNIVFNQN